MACKQSTDNCDAEVSFFSLAVQNSTSWLCSGNATANQKEEQIKRRLKEIDQYWSIVEKNKCIKRWPKRGSS